LVLLTIALSFCTVFKSEVYYANDAVVICALGAFVITGLNILTTCVFSGIAISAVGKQSKLVKKI
jgi:hypothetical protein